MQILKEFLNNVDKIKVKKFPEGRYKSIEEVFDKIIRMQLPKIDSIKKWHTLLTRYIKSDNLIIFIRRYSSDSNNDWNQIRRGFLTKNKEYSYVFCDNFLAHYFYIMAMNDYIPTYEDFKNLIRNRNFPYGFRDTKEERKIQAYKKGKTVKINDSGWKLSHLYSVNGNDYNFDYNKEKTILFPRGDINDWKINNRENFMCRTLSLPSVEQPKEKSIAHFVRLTHPINYFLSPQNKFSNFDIGENVSLIDRIKTYYLDEMPGIFQEFEEVSMSKIQKKVKKDGIDYQCSYGMKAGKNSFSLKQKNEQIVEKNIKNILLAYLRDGMSFRDIEDKVMGIGYKERGGGFKAKRIINSYGIEAKHKGILRDIEDIKIDFDNEKFLKNDLSILLEKVNY